MDTGLIHIYCGDGKGKTTASLGLVLRCAGRGGKILFAQFLKGRPTGELESLKALPQVTVLRGKAILKFTFQMTDAEKQATCEAQTALLQKVRDFCEMHHPDLAVCDELVGACALGLVPEEQVLDFLKDKPAHTEVVLTGRDPSPALLDLADYVSEIKKIKHPFDRGLAARIPLRGECTFTGGLATSPSFSRLLSEELGVPVNVPEYPQLVGAIGAALIAARI